MLDLVAEGIQHPGDLGDLLLKGLGVVRCQVGEVTAEEDEVLGLGQGGFGHVQEVGVVTLGLPLGPLG